MCWSIISTVLTGGSSVMVAEAASRAEPNDSIACVTFGPRPNSALFAKASRMVIPSLSARPTRAVSVAGPIPRLGVFKMRRNDNESAGLAMAMRYAMTSLISARS